MAILEALACSLPCLITTSCHFPELASAGGAIVVEPRTPAVTQGLRELLDRTDRERRRLGQIGRTLVESQYTWDQQATAGIGLPVARRRWICSRVCPALKLLEPRERIFS